MTHPQVRHPLGAAGPLTFVAADALTTKGREGGHVVNGVGGVRVVTSDAHAGLKDAVAANLSGAVSPRCRTHYALNLMSATPNSMWPAVKGMLHSVYDQPDTSPVNAQFDRLVNYVQEPLPHVCEHLTGAHEDILAFATFPEGLWEQIWSNKPNERPTTKSVGTMVGLSRF